MEQQKRLVAFFAIALAIMLGWHYLAPRPPQHPTQATPTQLTPKPTGDVAAPGTQPQPVPPPREVPRLRIAAPRVEGSLSLVGARLDDLVLRDYRETIAPNSPLVRLLEPRADPQPYYVQWGWTAAEGQSVKLPGNDTLWTVEGSGELTRDHPVTIAWDNGEGLTFRIAFAVDANYMFTVRQSVRNATGAPVALYPWSRIRRDYTPQVAGYYILHEGLLGVIGRRLQEVTYAKAKSEGEKHGGIAYEASDDGGWAGITDKYWLTALVPDQQAPVHVAFRHLIEDNADRYQVDFVATSPTTVAPGAEATSSSRLFAGAKEVHLLDRYETEGGIPLFSYAVDFGWFWFLTKPIFYALDWLYGVLGNFGLAILAFTIFVKALFFPLANKSYRSMSKMKLLAPKMQELRERYKDEPQKLQSEMMGLYRAEKVNPASGCLPMLIQVPVFFSLYKVIFVTIEMRHAPFFGWIRDLSAVDPTNIFNLFGLLPFDPTAISPMLHLGVWPLIMGLTMWGQQRLNPPPPDPVQARMFQFMPVIFTFMLARFPAGLVIYWTWNNLLTIGQQWLIMRQTRLDRPRGGAPRATVPARPADKTGADKAAAKSAKVSTKA